MPASNSYGQWQAPGMRPRSERSRPTVSVGRRSLGGDEQTMYSVSTLFHDQPSRQVSGGTSVMRPTSSLAGAMGEATISTIRSQSPITTWHIAQMQAPHATDAMTSYYPGAGETHDYFSPATNTADFYTNEVAATRNCSPESLLSSPPRSRQAYVAQYQTSHVAMSPHVATSGSASSSHPYSSTSGEEGEILNLRQRVRQLEYECSHARALLDGLRGAIPLPHPHDFQAAWESRTEARRRMYCSLNRAGNALCAWHDSRRERRIYPPRNAPPGYLNCGCTYEEALFEESLSRHGVGSYHPGEAVRMDPALRNPLLQLLKKRYGYRDGDFELDPLRETWMEGQTPEDWQRRAREGKAIKMRT
ncbi:hypothetical protein AX17_004735 [Amanita inopinata Kibby_2008]|nr:hypothetical protein AX17_004735 [Amanita inopinata Kibby_2008]